MDNGGVQNQNNNWCKPNHYPHSQRLCISVQVSPPLVAYQRQKMAKQSYRTFLTNFLNHVATINMTITIFEFFTKDCIPPRIPMPPLTKPFALLADQGHLRHYFPGQVAEPLSNTSIMLYAGHMVNFTTLAAGMLEWL